MDSGSEVGRLTSCCKFSVNLTLLNFLVNDYNVMRKAEFSIQISDHAGGSEGAAV